MIIELDLIPISLNRLYRQFRGRTIISKEGREFKALVSFLVKDIDPSKLMGEFTETEGLKVSIRFYSDKFYTKDKRIRKRYLDVDNLLKVVLDVVFKEIGLDDSYVTKLVVSKKPGMFDKTVIEIERNADV
jgi:Holliday junction resolvase RusA-like endonuclease